tara:strand:+ start:197 stop:901 length:705 start_codon:yes stop_codon:yes gene_type:complete
MRQQISRLAVGLLLALFASQSMAMDELSKKHYRAWIKDLYDKFDGEGALAVSERGAWATGAAMTQGNAKWKALGKCKEIAKQPETCKIVDVGGTSDFIKPRDSETSSGAQAMAEAFDGSTGRGNALTLARAEQIALAQCKKFSKKPDTCHIVHRQAEKSETSFSSPSNVSSSTADVSLVRSRGDESGCQEVFKNHWEVDRPSQNASDGMVGGWTAGCWDYISEDGKRWIGSNKK